MRFTMKQIAQLTGFTYQKVGHTARDLGLELERDNSGVSVDMEGLIKILKFYEEETEGAEGVVENLCEGGEGSKKEITIAELERQLLEAEETIDKQAEHIKNLTRANEMLRGIKRDWTIEE